jgi:hypothetical protein
MATGPIWMPFGGSARRLALRTELPRFTQRLERRLCRSGMPLLYESVERGHSDSDAEP